MRRNNACERPEDNAGKKQQRNREGRKARLTAFFDPGCTFNLRRHRAGSEHGPGNVGRRVGRENL